MNLLINISLFLFSCFVLWKASEFVVSGVTSFSRKLKISSFVVSFLLLGILTSITEISVGLNSVLTNQPEIFVGNLIGGSFVILLCIIPFLAIFNKGVRLKNHLDSKKLLYFLILIISPSLLILDGVASIYDAMLMIGLYILFVYSFKETEKQPQSVVLDNEDFRAILYYVLKIIIGAVLIFLASKILVDKTIYFASILNISSFIVSLLILAIGTNIPEIAIAINSIYNRKPDVAFGDYVGSAAANSMLFGVFTLMYGTFPVAAFGFSYTFFIVFIAYFVFYIFAKSKNHISVTEGLILLLIYVIFIVFQSIEILILSPKL